eukprot:CAMPEP_0114157094 /NCGR_PEP_ID=MMETSP0043_2-20121206/26428_1 /TAXON_ID=464988 /ORGANISM="Hemiselmis andersenii, Strain CCMP644" /LENGTH=334 /DNA_ID=CAMNT_0001252619 /DNA_START=31 /DNA_END=1033 /DNA_ORIENTATION=-
MVPHTIPGASACVEHVWASAKPGDPSDMPLRGASLRALGVLAHEEPYKHDAQVLIRMAGALDLCSRDPSLQVRMRAACSLASLCENTTIVDEGRRSEYVRHHAGLTLLRLSELSLRLMSDNDKVRVYGTRALGNLCHPSEYVTFVSASTSEAAAYQLCGRVESELCRFIDSPSYSVKVRWNACHAAGLLLSNPLASSPTPPWGKRLIGALERTGTEAENFKVRIQATRSKGKGLGIQATRSIRYAPQRSVHVQQGSTEGEDAEALVARWRGMIGAAMGEVPGLDSSQYKYKGTLRAEQRLCVLTLTSFLLPSDFKALPSLEESLGVCECLRHAS